MVTRDPQRKSARLMVGYVLDVTKFCAKQLIFTDIGHSMSSQVEVQIHFHEITGRRMVGEVFGEQIGWRVA
jgi:hypothetical protein